MSNSIQKAIDAVGGRVNLAKIVGVTPQAVYLWVNGATIKPIHTLEISKATNGA
ncbi:MAG: helix-turn-helix domain-containing protein, partial [Gammaproteobacteria bacterium]|nr:helix-turn-helix domain-containing protein [Gammaproteobacteria bacterium]